MSMRSSKTHGDHRATKGLAESGSSGIAPGKATLTGALASSLDEQVSSEPISVAIPATPGGRREGAASGAAQGEPQAIGDMQWEPIVSNLDSIAPRISFTGSVSRGGISLNAGEFGRTDSTPTLSGITITQGSGVFNVSAIYQLVTKWDTRSGTGPNGQVDIPDANAPAITAGNYRSVASDLTPNMSDLGGRPPRRRFWAQDLTELHEQVHVRDHQRTGREGLARALRWLSTQTASTQADVQNLLTQLQTRVVQYIVTSGAGTVGELHAYGDGAPLYQARADAILAQGRHGGYP